MADSPTTTIAEPRPLHRRVICWFAAVVFVAGAGWCARLAWLRFTPRPVVLTGLTHQGVMKVVFGNTYRNLPFTLSAMAEAAVSECEAIGAKARVRTNGIAEFNGDGVRARLEELRAETPGLFHADSMLATWYRRHGDEAKAELHAKKALDSAPVVLVQRFVFADGTPLVGGKLQAVQVECNRVQKRSLDPSLKLTFFDLTADADGCIRLPVYDTVYRLNSVSHPDGHDLDLPKFGWFEARGKVAILPEATVRKKE